MVDASGQPSVFPLGLVVVQVQVPTVPDEHTRIYPKSGALANASGLVHLNYFRGHFVNSNWSSNYYYHFWTIFVVPREL